MRRVELIIHYILMSPVLLLYLSLQRTIWVEVNLIRECLLDDFINLFELISHIFYFILNLAYKMTTLRAIEDTALIDYSSPMYYIAYI